MLVCPAIVSTELGAQEFCCCLLTSSPASLCRGQPTQVTLNSCAHFKAKMDILQLISVPAADPLRLSVVEQLKSKTSCVSMICVSLTDLPQVTRTGEQDQLGFQASYLSPSPSQAPDCLPCAPEEIVAAVLSLLKLCSGDSSASSSGCAEVFRNVTGSGRVQKCALDALSALSSSSGETTASRPPNR